MRVACTSAVLLVLFSTSLFAAAPDKPTLQSLRARADAAEGKYCAEVCLEAAQALVEDSDKQFTDGKPDLGQQEMKDAVEYASKACKASVQSDKRQKKTEIGLRKLSRRMTEIRQSLAIDDRPPVDDLIKVVEKLRTDLLMSMFDDKE